MEKIEKVDDQDKLLAHNSIKYLNSLTNLKELNVPTLKSLYRTKCKLMELRRHVFLPREKPNFRCHRCFMNFAEGATQHEIKSTKLTEYAKKVLRKVKNNKVLTAHQRVYYKKLQKKFPNGFGRQNKLVITCGFCQKESEIGMTKPKCMTPTKKMSVTTAKKKKKSKKDKFCGLNQALVSKSVAKKKNEHKNKLDQTLNDSVVFVSEYKPVNNYNNNLDASVSMTNTRVFETADFIPLETGIRKEKKIKMSRQVISKTEPKLQAMSKSKERLQTKQLKNLSSMLKNSKEIEQVKQRYASSLKQFLDSFK